MNWRRIGLFVLTVFVVATVVSITTGYKTFRIYENANQVSANIKYLIESGGTIGQAPADSALSSAYLDIIFSDEPELLEQLKPIVENGTEKMPDVRQGEVSAIIVTYRKNSDGGIENVVAHIAGGFPLGRRKISMHRDGFFAGQLDRNLWATGDSSLKFLGRDLIVWTGSEEDELAQKDLIAAVFSGEVSVLAESISQKPIYYTAVFPAPEQVVPLKMRHHVKAMVFRGHLTPENGSMEFIILSESEKSVALVAAMVHDIKTALQIALRTRFAGVLIDSPWGPYVPVWWAYEMANTLEDIQIERRDKAVRVSVQYERRMVNATLKTVERFGRDYSQIKGSLEDKLDPREVDAGLETKKPLHYWSEQHKWGPDWPFGASTNVIVRRPEDNNRTLDAAPEVTRPL